MTQAADPRARVRAMSDAEFSEAMRRRDFAARPTGANAKPDVPTATPSKKPALEMSDAEFSEALKTGAWR